MRLRAHPTLARFGGLLLVYVAALAVLVTLPALRPLLWIGAALIGLAGLLASRRGLRWRCRRCLYVIAHSRPDSDRPAPT
jgi:drug/metabolite transporter (DMT)-like permease